jgi:hypothetical protein
MDLCLFRQFPPNEYSVRTLHQEPDSDRVLDKLTWLIMRLKGLSKSLGPHIGHVFCGKLLRHTVEFLT